MKEITLARLFFLIGAGDIAAAVHTYHKGDTFMTVCAAIAAIICYVIGFSYVKGRNE